MKVEAWVDVLCPWCYIAERRLRRAVESVNEPDTITVVWRSFELDPTLDRRPGATAAEQMRADDWWGDQADDRIDQIRELGLLEGIEIDLERCRPVNTLDAHRVLHLAMDHQRGDTVMAALMEAYHGRGLDIADPVVLREVGRTTGLAAAVDETLASDAYTADVRADERRARQLGITSVPTLAINATTPISGVQSVEALRNLLERPSLQDR